MARKCPFCHDGVLERRVIREQYNYKGHTIEVDQPGEFCTHCEEGILNKEDLEATRQELHDFRAGIDGLLASGDIRRIRKKLKLNQKRAGALFGGGPNAFSRYELGKTTQPKAIDQLLRLLDRHPELLSEVEATTHP